MLTVQIIAARRLADAQASFADFITALQTDPSTAHAMGWSASAFENAARIKVYGQAIDWLAAGGSEADLKKQAMDAVLRAARNPPRSSSAQANLIEQEITTVWEAVHRLCADDELRTMANALLDVDVKVTA